MDNPRPVLTKADFVRRYAAGEFGNASPTWDTLEEFQAGGYAGLIHIRNRVAGAQTWYNIQAKDATWVWADAAAVYSPSLLYISAMAPTEKTIFQGEVLRAPFGLNLYCTTIAKPMREALQECSSHLSGINAQMTLEHYLCPKSQEWLMYLLDTYPDHVVEFSTYSCEWGTIPGFNTVYWEVRKY